MQDRVILITGGSRGIGAATARLAAQRGYRVLLTYRSDEASAQAVVNDIRATGGEAQALRADVAVEADVLATYALLDQQFGRLDVLVNNAGILEQQSRLQAMDVARWQRVLTTNVIGSFLCAREAIARMSTRSGGQGGAIVNVSSRAAALGGPNEYVDYAASKGAVDSMTIGLAQEVAADGIRVNAVRPGLIYTEIHASGGEPGRVDRLLNRVPLQRGGSAEEVAQSILWLGSDEASYTTGVLLDVSGGR